MCMAIVRVRLLGPSRPHLYAWIVPMMWRAVFTAALQVLALAPAPPLAAGSGTCQRITPGEPMDGNGCGPADSAVGNACSTASDCFFDGCRCEVVQLPCGSSLPGQQPPPPPRPPVGPPPTPYDIAASASL
eukprot:COSAG02_NODE_13719_length_1357_cov_1.812401_1_plen_130_part_10